MGRNLMAQITKYLSSYRRRRIGYWVLCSLGAVVVFCTTYALILPAITMSNEPICGFEAHTHDESCWSLKTLEAEAELICEEEWKDADVVCHTHSELCWDSTGALICPLEERELHAHDESCFAEERVLICELEGIEPGEDGEEPGEDAVPEPPAEQPPAAPAPDEEPHEHTEECYGFERGELICPLEESEGHQHTDRCYVSGRPTGEQVVICGETEGHVHTDECYEPGGTVLVCPLEESEGHWHGDACYTLDMFTGQPVLVCPLEESEGHWHNDACYITDEPRLVCGLEEGGHQHTDACFMPEVLEPVLACLLEEAEGHVHDDSCYEMVEVMLCETEDGEEPETASGQEPEPVYTEPQEPVEPAEEVHIHTDECYEIPQGPVCGKEVLELHTHGPECYEPIEEDDGMGGFEVRQVLICQLPVIIEHQHTEACVVRAEGEDREVMVRTCGLTVHVHDDSCYMELGPERDPYFCGMAEHAHTEDCFFESGELRCTIPEHAHTDECLDPSSAPETEYPMFPKDETEYICGLEEHWHGDACWLDGMLNCALEEHIHNEGCLPAEPDSPDHSDEPVETLPVCGLEEHTHGEECWTEDGELICGRDEHVHDESCLPEDEPDGDDGQDPDNPGEGDEQPDGPAVDENGLPLPVGVESVTFNDDYQFETDEFVVAFHVEGTAEVAREETDDEIPGMDGGASDTGSGDADPGDDDAWGDEETLSMTALSDAPVPKAFLPGQEDGEDDFLPDPVDSDGNNPDGSDLSDPVDFDVNVSMDPETSDEPGRGLEDGFLPPEGSFLTPEEAGISAQDIQFALEQVTEGEEFDAIMAQAEDMGGDELLLKVMRVVATAPDGRELDLSNCRITVEIRPSQMLAEALNQQTATMMIPETDGGTETTAQPETQPETQPDGGEVENVVVFQALTANGVLEGSELPVDDGDEADIENSVVTLSLDPGITTFGARVANTPNPTFRVQYCAKLDRVNLIPENVSYPIVIDTTKSTGLGRTPLNSDKNVPTKSLEINETTKKIATTKTLTEIYSAREFEYYRHPSLIYFDIVDSDVRDHYELKEVWVLQEGYDYEEHKDDRDPGEAWKTYPYNDKLHFTNRPESEGYHDDGGNYILIKEDEETGYMTTIKLVYDVKTANVSIDASFYDYDISSGNKKYGTNGFVMYTEKAGINSGFVPGDGQVRYAFGNKDTGSGYGLDDFKGHLINKANPNGYGNCSFGIVSGMNAKRDDVVFTNGIVGPSLFGKSDTLTGETATGETVTGKHDVTSLLKNVTFSRSGDTYTLVGAGGLTNLDSKWWKIKAYSGDKMLWSNDFWPLDGVAVPGRVDKDFGSSSETQRYAANSSVPESKYGKLSGSDNKKDHNSYFGMHFGVTFEVTKDYKGPLEYIFFGDDDMWVFLTDTVTGTDTLICDIGGVHGSVGEYVDLWDYIPASALADTDDEHPRKYELRFFYTERGASGSTCWMQFTLPSVSGLDQQDSPSNGSLKVEKKVEGPATDEQFEFTITLKKDGVPLYDNYSYSVYQVQEDGSATEVDHNLILSTFDGSNKFYLKANQYILVPYLPEGTEYTITESKNEYTTQINGTIEEGRMASGTIGSTGTQQTVLFTNLYLYSLPATGGPSTIVYTLGGGLLLAAAGCLVYKKGSKRRGAADRT